MSSKRAKRKTAPTKFDEKPGIPDDDYTDNSVNEESLPSGGDSYNSEEEEEQTFSSDSEKTPPPKKKNKVESSNSKGRKKKEPSSEDGERTFKILVDSIVPENNTPPPSEKILKSDGGKSKGKNPMQAAKKIFNRICRCTEYDDGEGKKSSYKGSYIYVFKIQETTPGSANKIFSYRGERLRLDKPQLIPRGEIEYYVNYTSKVKSYKPGNLTKKEEEPSPPPTKKTSTAKSKSATSKKNIPKKGTTTTPKSQKKTKS